MAANTKIGLTYQITTADVTNTLILGDASPGGESVSAWHIHIVDGSAAVPTALLGGWVAPVAAVGLSVTIVGRTRQAIADKANIPFVGTLYRKLFLNGLIGDGSLVATAITTTSSIIIPATGQSIAILVGALTSGNALVYATPCVGPSVI